jgi:hypothetical protein
MVKKQIKKSKNNNNEIRESKKENIKEKDNKIKSKKFSIKITSKMKKKLKYTQNKLKIDKIKIKKIISHIIKEEPPIIKQNNKKMKEKDNSDEEDIGQEGGVSIYLYITLKKELNDEEKRIFKNKLLKIKYPMINDIIYLCLIEDKLTNDEKDKLKELTDNRIDIITKEEFKNNIKNLENIDLDNQYQLFISNINNNINFDKKLEVVYYQKNKFEIIKDLIENIYKGATVIKMVNKKNNIFKIKFGYTNMDKEELTDNAYRLIYKSIPFILSNVEKYNGIENILIKTKESIPFNLFGNINPEDINNFNL